MPCIRRSLQALPSPNVGTSTSIHTEQPARPRVRHALAHQRPVPLLPQFCLRAVAWLQEPFDVTGRLASGVALSCRKLTAGLLQDASAFRFPGGRPGWTDP